MNHARISLLHKVFYDFTIRFQYVMTRDQVRALSSSRFIHTVKASQSKEKHNRSKSWEI